MPTDSIIETSTEKASVDLQQSKANFLIQSHANRVRINKKKKNLDIAAHAATAIVTSQLIHSTATAAILAIDQLSKLSNILQPAVDSSVMLSNAGVAAVIFSGLLTLATIGGLIVAAVKNKEETHAFKQYLLGERGLKALVPAAFGLISGGVMIAMASQPIAIIVAGAIAFGIHSITEISHVSPSIHRTSEQITELKKQLKIMSNSNEKKETEEALEQLKIKLSAAGKRLGISIASLIVGATAFTLLGFGATALTAGATVMGPALLGLAGIILGALSIFSISMMALGIHQKRMANRKNNAITGPSIPEEKITSASSLKRSQSYCPSQSLNRQIPGFSNAYKKNRQRSQNDDSIASTTKEKHTPKTDAEKKTIKQGLLGMGMAARKHAAQQVHGEALDLSAEKVIPQAATFNAISNIKPEINTTAISNADIESAWAHKHIAKPRSFTDPLEGSQWSSASSVHTPRLTLTLNPTSEK